MATLLSTDGTQREITPHGAVWAMEELEGIVGGRPEVLRTTDGRYLVTNETSKVQRDPLPPNMAATILYKHGDRDYIAGPAVLVESKLELDGPEDEDGDTRCPYTGRMGIHSDEYYDGNGGRCVWCGQVKGIAPDDEEAEDDLS